MPDQSDDWVEKAEGDVRTALRELAVQEHPNWDAVCFHAQQAVEKYLKALLITRGEAFPKTHDLRFLLDMVARHFPEWAEDREEVSWLSFSAVEARYPGQPITREEAERAVAVMQRSRTRLRAALDLPAS